MMIMHDEILAADPEWLKVKYIDEKLSIKEIAQLIGYSECQTSRILKKIAGIELRNNSEKASLFWSKKEKLI